MRFIECDISNDLDEPLTRFSRLPYDIFEVEYLKNDAF